MKRLLCMTTLVLLCLNGWGQDWMKAEWYTTKEQVISRVGAPIEDSPNFLLYDTTISGMRMAAEYHFENEMLQSVFLAPDGGAFEPVLARLVETYGRPADVKQLIDGSRVLTWRTPSFWVQLVHYSGYPFGIQYFPLDTSDPGIRSVRDLLRG